MTIFIECLLENENHDILFEFDFLGPYSTWSHEDKGAENYCEYKLFMFAFAFLICEWVLLPLLVIGCWHCFYFLLLEKD